MFNFGLSSNMGQVFIPDWLVNEKPHHIISMTDPMLALLDEEGAKIHILYNLKLKVTGAKLENKTSVQLANYLADHIKTSLINGSVYFYSVRALYHDTDRMAADLKEFISKNKLEHNQQLINCNLEPGKILFSDIMHQENNTPFMYWFLKRIQDKSIAA